MDLLISLLAVVASLLAAARLLSAARLRGRTVSRATVAGMLAAGAAALLAAGLYRDSVNGLLDSARGLAALPDSAIQQSAAASLGIDDGFMTWAGARMPRSARYYVTSTVPLPWLSYRLLPRLAVDRPRDADYLLWDGSGGTSLDPAARSRFGPEEVYGPGYGIARRYAR